LPELYLATILKKKKKKVYKALGFFFLILTGNEYKNFERLAVGYYGKFFAFLLFARV